MGKIKNAEAAAKYGHARDQQAPVAMSVAAMTNQGSGPANLADTQMDKVVKAAQKIAAEERSGLYAGIVKDRVFKGTPA